MMGFVWQTCSFRLLEKCFYQTLILTAPIHSRASITETRFYKSDEETNSSWSWMTWRRVHFQQITFLSFSSCMNQCCSVWWSPNSGKHPHHEIFISSVLTLRSISVKAVHLVHFLTFSQSTGMFLSSLQCCVLLRGFVFVSRRCYLSTLFLFFSCI